LEDYGSQTEDRSDAVKFHSPHDSEVVEGTRSKTQIGRGVVLNAKWQVLDLNISVIGTNKRLALIDAFDSLLTTNRMALSERMAGRTQMDRLGSRSQSSPWRRNSKRGYSPSKGHTSIAASAKTGLLGHFLMPLDEL
jgi:hypothetical protein